MQLPANTRVQYIPYERVIKQDILVRKHMPRQVPTTQYRKVKKKGVRPVQRSQTRFYEIEYITDYVQEVHEEMEIDMVEQTVAKEVVKLVPHEVQYIHVPDSYYSQVKQGDSTLHASIGSMTLEISFAGEFTSTVIFENQQTGECFAAGQMHNIRKALTSGDSSERYFLRETQGDTYHLVNFFTRQYLSVQEDKLLLREPSNNQLDEWYLDMVDNYSAKLRNAANPFLVVGHSLTIEEETGRLSQRWRILGLRQLEKQYR